MSFNLRVLSIAVVFSTALPAFADNFTFTFSDAFGGGNVTLGATSNSAGNYLVNSAMGTIDGLNIVSLVAPGGYPAPSTGDTPNDNLLSFTNSTYFDLSGVAFELFGGEYLNAYADSGAYYSVTGGMPYLEVGPNALTDLSVSAAAVTPEPSSLLLLSPSLLGIGGALKRRMAKQ